MDETPNLRLPYILAAQSQKHVTHNEAIRALDAVVQLAVLDRHLTSPPGSPAEGARYIVAASPSGAWSGQAERIAAFQDGAWAFYPPAEGWLAWVADEDVLLAWDGAAWVVAGGGGINPAPLVGVNTTADATNRLAVKSDAVLFSHDDVTPGSGDQRTVLNKASASGTASLLFQDDFSGRAEFGLTGDDNFHVKVSPDGSTWYDALIVNKAGGHVVIGATASQQVQTGLEAKFQIHGDAASQAILHFSNWQAGPQQPFFFFTKSRGASVGTHAVVSSGDNCMTLVASGSDGAKFLRAAQISVVVDGTAAADDMPGRLSFFTNGGAALTERMRLGCDGSAKFPTIGTTASAANAFLDSGSTPANSLLRSTSSARYKRDVEDMEPLRAERLLAARPIWYRSKCAADNPGWSWYGLLAEEMADIDPRLVHWGYPAEAWEEVTVGEGEGASIERRLKPGAKKLPESVAYDRLTVGLLALVQTLWAKVEALEGRG